MIDPEYLVSQKLIAEHQGVTRQAVNLWTQEPDWPAPVITTSPAHLWDWRDVEAWLIAHGKRPAEVAS